MRPFKFLHMADMHMDAPFSSLNTLGGTTVERRLEQRLVFKKIVNLADQRNVDAILISGDLFEHEYVSRGTVAFLNECFDSVPHIKVFISPGNHDPYVKNSYYSSYEWSSNIHIFKDKLESIHLDNFNTSVYGVGFNDFLLFESRLKGFKVKDESRINILIVHASVDNLAGPPGYHTISSTEMETSGFDYIALGHIHKFIPDLIKGKACYPGSSVSLGFDEPGRHGVIIGQVEKGIIDLEFIPVDTKEYITLQVDVTNCQTSHAIASKVLDAINPGLQKENYYRIIVSGMVRPEILEELNLVKELLIPAVSGYKLILKYDLSPEYDYGQIALGNDLKALFVRKLLEEIKNESNEVRVKRLQKSLHLGLCALEGRRVTSV